MAFLAHPRETLPKKAFSYLLFFIFELDKLMLGGCGKSKVNAAMLKQTLKFAEAVFQSMTEGKWYYSGNDNDEDHVDIDHRPFDSSFSSSWRQTVWLSF